MMRQNVQHLLAFFFAVLANLTSQDIFRSGFMCALIEFKATAELRLLTRGEVDGLEIEVLSCGH